MSRYFVHPDGTHFWPEPNFRFLHDVETDHYGKKSRVAAPDWAQSDLDSTPETVPLFAGRIENGKFISAGKQTVKLPSAWQSLMYRVQPNDLARNYIDTQANGWFNSPFPNCETIGYGGQPFQGEVTALKEWIK